MALVDLDLVVNRSVLPADVRRFLREADRRIRKFRWEQRIPGFVPGDYGEAYATLKALDAADLVEGHLFCEWGSGFGVVTCLAAMIGFDAIGIEIEDQLVDAAQQLAADFEISVEFIQGSYIPNGGGDIADGDFAWLAAHEGTAHEEVGLNPDDFNVIFAYPWPDEENLVEELFESYGGNEAVLVSYHGISGLRIRRKCRPPA